MEYIVGKNPSENVIVQSPNIKYNRKSKIIIFLLVIFFVIITIVIYINRRGGLVDAGELNKVARDGGRLADLVEIENAIKKVESESSANTINLCFNTSFPCEGMSNKETINTRKNDGLGWLKINDKSLVKQFPYGYPLDPLNSESYFYRYCSDGKNWEIEISLESKRFQDKMISDMGDNPKKYEVGTNLNLCKLKKFSS